MIPIKQWLMDLFTEPDNKTLCPIRLLGVIGVLQGFISSGYSVFFQGVAFDLQTYGIGFGSLIGALGIALGIKTDTPSERNDNGNICNCKNGTDVGL